MAISPPSDIVLDVARAVDPLSYSAAAEKLGRAAAAPEGAGQAFSELMRTMPPAPEPNLPFHVGAAMVERRNESALAADRAAVQLDPYQRFEAFVLQSFMETMLPEQSSGLYGDDPANGMWTSMLAEQLGMQLAKSGTLGIADHLGRATPYAARYGGGVEPASIPLRPALMDVFERQFLGAISASGTAGPARS